MMYGFLIDCTKLKNIKNSKYTNDIVKIKLKEDFIKYDVPEPKPFIYNEYKKTKKTAPVFNMLNNRSDKDYKLHISSTNFYEGYTLMMISRYHGFEPGVTKIKDIIKYYNKLRFSRNIKATFLNKKHLVHGYAIIYVVKDNKVINMAKEIFVKKFFENAKITGEKNISYHKMLYNDLNKKTLKYRKKAIKLLGYDEDPDDLKIKQQMNSLREKLQQSGHGKCEWCKEYVPKFKIDAFFNNEQDQLYEDFRTKKINKKTLNKQKKKLQEKRKEIALSFMKHLSNYVTLEDVYFIISAQLNHQYVKLGLPWYQSFSTDVTNEDNVLTFQLVYGVTEYVHDMSVTDYMWKITDEYIY